MLVTRPKLPARLRARRGHGDRRGRKIPARLRDHRGMTLIETLVAILTGVVVTGALFAILEVSLRQTARIDDVVQANQLGRGAMTRVIDDLHSTCISPGYTPILSESTESTLWLQNAYSAAAVIGKAEAFKHKIAWDKTKKTLTETTYPANGGEWPKFTFSGTPTSTVQLASNVTQGEAGAKALPIFRYYNYATSASGTAETPEGTLSELPITGATELKTKAGETVAVNVTFKQAPTDTTAWSGHVPVEFSNLTTLAFSSPASESKVEGSPCH